MPTDPALSGQPGVPSLLVRRRIRASAARLFSAWTRPEQLRVWWGPRSVVCLGAEVDLRVGGGYRIAHRIADGSHMSISGVFQQIDPPDRLVYTWRCEPGPAVDELVTVRFEPVGGATEVVVLHERIAGDRLRQSHESGWVGCLEALDEFVAEPLSEPV